MSTFSWIASEISLPTEGDEDMEERDEEKRDQAENLEVR